MTEPQLGHATTRQLLDELTARIAVDYSAGGGGLGYTTVGGRPGIQESRQKRIIVANYTSAGHHVDDQGAHWWDETQHDRSTEVYFKSGWDAALKEIVAYRDRSPIRDDGLDKLLRALRGGGVTLHADTQPMEVIRPETNEEGAAFLERAHDMGLRPSAMVTPEGALLSVGQKVQWRLEVPGYPRGVAVIAEFDPRRALQDGKTIRVEREGVGETWVHPGWIEPADV